MTKMLSNVIGITRNSTSGVSKICRPTHVMVLSPASDKSIV